MEGGGVPPPCCDREHHAGGYPPRVEAGISMHCVGGYPPPPAETGCITQSPNFCSGTGTANFRPRVQFYRVESVFSVLFCMFWRSRHHSVRSMTVAVDRSALNSSSIDRSSVAHSKFLRSIGGVPPLGETGCITLWGGGQPLQSMPPDGFVCFEYPLCLFGRQGKYSVSLHTLAKGTQTWTIGGEGGPCVRVFFRAGAKIARQRRLIRHFNV